MSKKSQGIPNGLERWLSRRTRVIVEPGNRGRVSTRARNGWGVLGIDPEMPSQPDWGENDINQPERGGSFFGIRERTREVKDRLRGRASGVLIVAPDPRDAEDMISDADEMLRPGGRVVAVFDKRSNLRHLVRGTVRDLRQRYRRHPDFEIHTYEDLGEDEIGEKLGAEVNLNSFSPLEENLTCVVRRRRG